MADLFLVGSVLVSLVCFLNVWVWSRGVGARWVQRFMVLVVGVISIWFSMFMSGGKDYFLMYVEDDRAWLLELVEDADSGHERLFWEEKVRELDDLVEEVE